MHESRRIAKLILAFGLIAMPLAECAHCASTNNWQLAPPAIGNWADPTSWSSGTPTGAFGEIAVINNGGTASISQNTSVYDVVLGQAATDSGKLLQSSSTLNLAGDLYIGEFGTGSFEFSGGLEQSGDVFVGVRPGSHGTLTISGGTFKPGYILMGRAFNIFPPGSGGNATVMQTAGTVEIFYAALTIEGDQSSYQLKGGTLRALDQIIVGRGANNRFIQSGGVNDAHSSSGGGYYSGAVRVGVEADQLATYELSAGDLLTNYSGVGCYKGQGLFVQTGGQHHVFGNLGVAGEEMSSGSYELRNGALLVDQGLNIGTQGPGTFTTYGSVSTIQSRDLSVGNSGSLVYSITNSGISTTKVTHNASISGILKVLDAGAPIGNFLLIDATNSLTFNSANIQLPGPTWGWQQVGKQLFVSHVPEPTSLFLLVTTTVSVIAVRRPSRRPLGT
jgi:hypothetical protein